MSNRFPVRKVAVLGAGVMGAQIAAHLVNVNVPVILFDLPAKEGPKNGIVTKAVDGLKKLKPAPMGVPELAARIEPANYDIVVVKSQQHFRAAFGPIASEIIEVDADGLSTANIGARAFSEFD